MFFKALNHEPSSVIPDTHHTTLESLYIQALQINTISGFEALIPQIKDQVEDYHLNFCIYKNYAALLLADIEDHDDEGSVGRVEEVVAMFKRAVYFDEDYDSYLIISELSRPLKDVQQGLAFLIKALDISVTNRQRVETMALATQFVFDCGDYDLALVWADRALRIDNTHAQCQSIKHQIETNAVVTTRRIIYENMYNQVRPTTVICVTRKTSLNSFCVDVVNVFARYHGLNGRDGLCSSWISIVYTEVEDEDIEMISFTNASNAEVANIVDTEMTIEALLKTTVADAVIDTILDTAIDLEEVSIEEPVRNIIVADGMMDIDPVNTALVERTDLIAEDSNMTTEEIVIKEEGDLTKDMAEEEESDKKVARKSNRHNPAPATAMLEVVETLSASVVVFEELVLINKFLPSNAHFDQFGSTLERKGLVLDVAVMMRNWEEVLMGVKRDIIVRKDVSPFALWPSPLMDQKIQVLLDTFKGADGLIADRELIDLMVQILSFLSIEAQKGNLEIIAIMTQLLYTYTNWTPKLTGLILRLVEVLVKSVQEDGSLRVDCDSEYEILSGFRKKSKLGILRGLLEDLEGKENIDLLRLLKVKVELSELLGEDQKTVDLLKVLLELDNSDNSGYSNILKEKFQYYTNRIGMESSYEEYENSKYDIVITRLRPLLTSSLVLEFSKKVKLLQVLRLSLKKVKDGMFIECSYQLLTLLLTRLQTGFIDYHVWLQEFYFVLVDLVDCTLEKKFDFLIFQSVQLVWSLLRARSEKKVIMVSPMTADFIAVTFILFFSLEILKPSSEGTVETLKRSLASTTTNNMAEVMIFVHDQIGAISHCHGLNGQLLNLIISHLSSVSSIYHHEVYQSMHCLYNLKVKIWGSQILLNHKNKKSVFDADGALLLYQFIEPYLKLAVVENKTLSKDVSECLDIILRLYPQAPLDNPTIKENLIKLQALLARSVNPFSTARSGMIICTNIPLVCYSIFLIHAKNLLESYYFSKRNTNNLEESIQFFISHLLINPEDADCWTCLGNAYFAQCLEVLGMSVLDDTLKRQVAKFQRAAYHCFELALHFMKEKIDGLDTMVDALYTDIILLGRSINSKPMDGYAFHTAVVQLNGDVDKDSKALEREYVARCKKQLYLNMTTLLKASILKDKNNYHAYFHLSHVYAKLKVSPAGVIKLYLRGLNCMPQGVTKEQDLVLDPIYKAIAYVTKRYLECRLSRVDAEEALALIIGQHPILQTTYDTIEGVEGNVGFLVRALKALKKIDKKKWYHKPYYLLSRLYSNNLNLIENGKLELLTLLNVKTKLRRIFKTELELHGRHYVYYTSYLEEIVRLAAISEDFALLTLLARRLEGEENMIDKVSVRDKCRMELVQLIKKTQVNHKAVDEMDLVLNIDVEKDMVLLKDNRLQALLAACEIKRLTKDACLDPFIRCLYATLYLECTQLKTVDINVKNIVKEGKMALKVLQRAVALAKAESSHLFSAITLPSITEDPKSLEPSTSTPSRSTIPDPMEFLPSAPL